MIGRACIGAMVLVASCSVVSADGYNFDVQSLHNLCKAEQGSQEFAICAGYISGVAQLMQFIEAEADLRLRPEFREFAICSGSVSYDAMVQAFKTWAEKNPRNGSDDKLVGVMLALRENWPCTE